VHGLGGTPSTTWGKKLSVPNQDSSPGESMELEQNGTEDIRVNWLSHETMLPAQLKNARIMVYNYNSNWYGEDAVKLRLDSVANDFRTRVEQERRVMDVEVNGNYY
jgi:hypothetical protein